MLQDKTRRAFQAFRVCRQSRLSGRGADLKATNKAKPFNKKKVPRTAANHIPEKMLPRAPWQPSQVMAVPNQASLRVNSVKIPKQDI